LAHPHAHAPAGKTVAHIKQVPGWSETLASDAEAVVKAEHDVSRVGGLVGGWQRRTW